MDQHQGTNDEGKYTVAEEPPRVQSQRRSQWVELFEECRRRPGQWRRARRTFAKSSAGQLASDVRSAARRDPDSMRIRGLREGELWESLWAPLPDWPTPGRFGVWLRFVGMSPPDTGAVGVEPVPAAVPAAVVDPRVG